MYSSIFTLFKSVDKVTSTAVLLSTEKQMIIRNVYSIIKKKEPVLLEIENQMLQKNAFKMVRLS